MQSVTKKIQFRSKNFLNNFLPFSVTLTDAQVLMLVKGKMLDHPSSVKSGVSLTLPLYTTGNRVIEMQ